MVAAVVFTAVTVALVLATIVSEYATTGSSWLTIGLAIGATVASVALVCTEAARSHE